MGNVGFFRNANPMTSLTFGRSIKIATLVPGFGAKTVRKRRVRLNSGKDLSDVSMQIVRRHVVPLTCLKTAGKQRITGEGSLDSGYGLAVFIAWRERAAPIFAGGKSGASLSASWNSASASPGLPFAMSAFP